MSLSPPSADLDRDACAREPIHIPGGIQPHGVLLVVTEPDLLVIQASANAGVLIGRRTTDNVLNKPLVDYLGDAQVRTLQAKLDRLASEDRAVHTGVFELQHPSRGTLRFDLVAHRRDGMLVLELEEAIWTDAMDLEEFPSRTLQFLASLEGKKDPSEICTLAAREVRRLSHFDRVLIYRFDEQWNGQVVAEDSNGRLGRHMDHRFPASDIPAQARALYRVNRSRMIPDAGYAPVPLLPQANPHTGHPLDLTHSMLRSVSPVHLEYMRNMGTAASMSFSILRDGELWGLISCHNTSPRQVPFHVRRACELVAQVFSLQLAAAERQAEIEYHVRLRQVGSRLLAAMTAATGFSEGLLARPDDLLAAASAEGAAVLSDDGCHLIGRTPGEVAVRQIVAWLERTRPGVPVYHTHNLPAEMPEAGPHRATASGVLAISASERHRAYVLWFRPEMIETITWAGNPQKTALPDAGQAGEGRLSPRKSFEAWQEVVRGQARPWHKAEIGAAAELQADVVGIVLRKAEALAALSSELQRSNNELESFSYSVSHDLRAPFRHIVGYSELVQEYEAANLSDRGRRYLQTVIDSAREAGKLIDNLLSFSQMGRAGLHPIKVDLNVLCGEVRAEVMEAEGRGRRIDWEIAPLPVVSADLAMLRLAIRNLLANAVKYTRDRSDEARITIHCRTAETEYEFCIGDNGVGFDMRYVDKLFGVFQRLHRAEEFEGTGIGLANVRRIIGRHGGRTWAEGVLGKGASFFFTLPRGVPGDQSSALQRQGQG